jgi:MFS family permease
MMSRLSLLMVITFIESFATILVERGVYFFADKQLSFTPKLNLWLALFIGAGYTVGALLSHRLSVRWGEKAVLLGTVTGQLLSQVALFVVTDITGFLALNALLAGLTGMKWPVVESYISAGRLPAEASKAVGAFNVSWSLSVPIALVTVGLLLRDERTASLVFLLGSAINVLTLILCVSLERRPVHLAADHPERLEAGLLERMRLLMVSSRFSMLCSYALLFILVPLIPGIFRDRLKLEVAWATAMAALMDVPRIVAFIALRMSTKWHGRADWLAAGVLGLPVGFFLVLLGGTLPVVLLGELIFGLSAGLVYYSALYYAMVVKNASVDAGGEHEGLIGVGFTLGPAAGLVSLSLAGPLGSAWLGNAVGIGPLLGVSLVLSLSPLLKLRGVGRAGQ